MALLFRNNLLPPISNLHSRTQYFHFYFLTLCRKNPRQTASFSPGTAHSFLCKNRDSSSRKAWCLVLEKLLLQDGIAMTTKIKKVLTLLPHEP